MYRICSWIPRGDLFNILVNPCYCYAVVVSVVAALTVFTAAVAYVAMVAAAAAVTCCCCLCCCCLRLKLFHSVQLVTRDSLFSIAIDKRKTHTQQNRVLFSKRWVHDWGTDCLTSSWEIAVTLV